MYANNEEKLYDLLRTPIPIRDGDTTTGEDSIRFDQALFLARVLHCRGVRVLTEEEISTLARLKSQEERWHEAIDLGPKEVDNENFDLR